MPPVPNPDWGQRPGPVLLSNSTRMAFDVNSMLVMVAASSQNGRSCGLSQIVASVILNGSYRNDPTGENGVVMPFTGSLACTRQKYVPRGDVPVLTSMEV